MGGRKEGSVRKGRKKDDVEGGDLVVGEKVVFPSAVLMKALDSLHLIS